MNAWRTDLSTASKNCDEISVAEVSCIFSNILLDSEYFVELSAFFELVGENYLASILDHAMTCETSKN